MKFNIKLKIPFILLSSGFLFFLFYLAIALGIGRRLNVFIESCLIIFSLALVVAPFASKKISQIIYGATVLFTTVLIIWDTHEVQKLRDLSPTDIARNIATNEHLLKNALAKIPCTNGDQLILSMMNNPGTERFSLSVQLISKNKQVLPYILISTDGRFIPPKAIWIEEFEQKFHLACSTEEFPNLQSIHQKLLDHYERERVKY